MSILSKVHPVHVHTVHPVHVHPVHVHPSISIPPLVCGIARPALVGDSTAMTTFFLVVRVLLAAIFIVFGLNYWLNFLTMPEVSGDAGRFLGLLYGSGYLAVVKVVEVAGGVLVLRRRTAALGVVLLAAVIVNILCYDAFLAKALNPVAIVAAVLTLITAWDVRDRLLGLIAPSPKPMVVTVAK